MVWFKFDPLVISEIPSSSFWSAPLSLFMYTITMIITIIVTTITTTVILKTNLNSGVLHISQQLWSYQTLVSPLPSFRPTMFLFSVFYRGTLLIHFFSSTITAATTTAIIIIISSRRRRDRGRKRFVCWLVAYLTSQQHAHVSQGRICTDNFTRCHTEMEAADQTFHLTQSQYTDTGPTSPSADPITPGAWQGSHWSANFKVTGMTRPRKSPAASGIRTRDLPLSRRTP